MIQKPLINNRIRAKEVRLIDDAGKQVGIVPIQEALQMARERNLDLIQVTGKIDPPVCKIIDYGKYLYQLQKKEKGTKKSVEIKGLRLRFNISDHDLETRVHQAEKFIKKGDKVKVDMVLRGREKGLSYLAKDKIGQFIDLLEKVIPIKVEGDLKKSSRGFTIIISGDVKHEIGNMEQETGNRKH